MKYDIIDIIQLFKQMNNPFTSNRTLFDIVPKPKRQIQQDNPNQIPNARNTQQLSTRGQTTALSNQKNISGNSFNNNGNINMNTGTFNTKSNTNYLPVSTSNNKVDLNFRSEFRPSTLQENNIENKKYFNVNFDNSVSNTSMSSNLNTSSNNANLYPSTSSNFQNKIVSDKQYPSYQQSQQYSQYGQSKSYQASQNGQGSSIPSVTLPSLSVSNSNSSKMNPLNNNLGFGGGSISKSNLNGVERQKITFGVASMQENIGGEQKLEYDRSKFVNRQQFHDSYPNTNNYNSNSSTPGQKINNLPISPIQQKSKHMMMMDEHSSSFMDIDAMGDDIEKILASSKNQQQLCRLLGIPNNNPHAHEKIEQNVSFKNTHTQPYQRSYSQNPNPNIQSSSRNGYKASQNSNFNAGGSINFNKKNSSPVKNQSSLTPNKNTGAYDIYRNDFNSVHQKNQVFDYESQNNIQPNSNKNINLNYNTNPINESTRVIKNPNLAASIGNSNYPVISANPQIYSNQLQQTIQNQMKKLSIRGRVRTFLSATDKIQTVKYNMEYI